VKSAPIAWLRATRDKGRSQAQACTRWRMTLTGSRR
jgi:hypothetical protein